MPCKAELLEGIGLFEELAPDDRAQLARVIESRQVPAGDTLFRAGDPGDSLYIVCAGQMELSIRDTAGQKIVLNNARTGEIFGELALLDGGARTATAVAATDVELLELDRDDLLLLFRTAPHAALHFLAVMGHMTRKADNLLKTRVARNVNEEVAEDLTPLQRVADWIAWFSGSMPFLFLNLAWFGVWIAINALPLGIPAFDPYPFGLLTMIVSLEAIFLSCFVLISQNRQSEKDHVRSDIEYEINVKAELEVAHLHEKTDQIFVEMQQRFARLEALLARSAADKPAA
jgi:CRP/FNR family transcriptional regulator, cyclic AMP receptor protein